MSKVSGTVTSLPVHPESPVLLTKTGPLEDALHSAALVPEGKDGLTHLKFENRPRAARAPDTSNHSLYLM